MFRSIVFCYRIVKHRKRLKLIAILGVAAASGIALWLAKQTAPRAAAVGAGETGRAVGQPDRSPVPSVTKPHPRVDKPAPNASSAAPSKQSADQGSVHSTGSGERAVAKTGTASTGRASQPPDKTTKTAGSGAAQGLRAAAPTAEKPKTNKRAGKSWINADGAPDCPPEFPIKGNASSHIYHLPGQPSYAVTIPELCFATEEAATEQGYRPRKR